MAKAGRSGGAKSSGSKNNVANRGQATSLRMFEGRVVKPTQYIPDVGASYIAARFVDSGEFLLNEFGQPVQYKMV